MMDKADADECWNRYQSGDNETEICNEVGCDYDDFWNVINDRESSDDED